MGDKGEMSLRTARGARTIRHIPGAGGARRPAARPGGRPDRRAARAVRPLDPGRPPGLRHRRLPARPRVAGREVAGLTLDDVDAVAGTLQLEAGKPRRMRILP